MNRSKPVLRFGLRSVAFLAGVAFLAEFAGAQTFATKLTPDQLAARRARVSRMSDHGGGPVLADPPNGMNIVTGLSATALANALLGSGVTLSGTPTLQGNALQAGTFTNAPALVGFSSGIILSSGNVTDAGSTWAGANSPNTSEGTAGYAPLSDLIGGQSTNDAAVLQFSFIPTTSTIYFTYVFASAEYPNYVGSYNDPMGLFVNGTASANNVAVLPLTPPVPVTINNVNATTHPGYFNKYNTTGDSLSYGGETKVLTATATVNPGQVNTITLAVADAMDSALDSAVFIQAGSLSTTAPAGAATAAGAPALSPGILAGLGLMLLFFGVLMLRSRQTAE